MADAPRVTGFACDASANRFIERWFGDCIYTPWETLAFCIGLSSMFFWIFAQLPQFISNFVRKSADALSPWFLTQWLLGDSFNLMGCLLTGDQLATQTITAGYFIFSDFLIITQYLYYRIRNKKLEGGSSDSDESLHKAHGYSDLQNAYPRNSLENIFSQSAHKKTSEETRALERTNQNLVSRHCNITVTCSDQTQRIDGNATSSSLLDIKAPDDTNIAGPSLPLPFSDLNEQNSWMYQHRHRLRRLVHEYGLEYGQETIARLNKLYKKNHKDSFRRNISRRGIEDGSRASRRAHYKALLGVACFFCFTTKLQLSSTNQYSNSTEFQSVLGRRTLLSLPKAAAANAVQWTVIIGQLFGWASSALYLGSRLSQLIKNRRRRSAEGLSLGMVTCAVLANTTYGASILMRVSSWDYIIAKAPWLVGSIGTVFLDFTMFIQANYYNWKANKGKPTEYTPLLA